MKQYTPFAVLGAIALGGFALAACVPADGGTGPYGGNVDPQATQEPLPPRNGLAPVYRISERFYGIDVGYFCHKGRAVYIADDAGTGISVVENAPECQQAAPE